MNVKTHPTLLSDMLVSNFGSIVNDIFKEEGANPTSFRPRLELIENDIDYQLNLALPGIKKEEISIKQEGNLLRITGERKIVETAGKRLINEFNYGNFSRSVRLPKNATHDGIVASYENGILNITIAKQEEVKPKEIRIK
ncbi:MAG: heat-shock protein Hsp20 [Bacteroidetes bacterium]|nr:MAG: heat-shock protein Hsp20 [Bacteroidota bacterium]